MVHRDLKHRNIFLSEAGESPKVKIGDFGLSAKLPPGESIICNAGTTGYMAPETILEECSDSRVDVWSLGTILFALICSRMPF